MAVPEITIPDTTIYDEAGKIIGQLRDSDVDAHDLVSCALPEGISTGSPNEVKRSGAFGMLLLDT